MDRYEIVELIATQTGNTVQTGPFRGMRLSSAACWGDGDVAAKLLGVYEQELHPYLEEFTKQQYDEVVDVGAAEGYYAVGCALAFRDTIVRAFDTNEQSHAILHENARLNDVANRLTISSYCSSQTLAELSRGKRILAIVDCEGGEIDLLDGENVINSLRHSDLIVECHDFLDPVATGKIVGRFFPSHRLAIVYSEGRNPSAFPFLAGLSDVERWLAICEHRPVLMSWLICWSKTPVPT